MYFLARCLFLRPPPPPFLRIIFANLLKFFYVAIQIDSCANLTDFGFRMWFLSESLFLEFADFAWKRRAKVGVKTFMVSGRLFLRGWRPRGGFPNYADCVESCEKLYSRLAPFAGERRISRLRPCRRPLWLLQAYRLLVCWIIVVIDRLDCLWDCCVFVFG